MCRGSGRQSTCVMCRGRATEGSSSTLCSGSGIAHIVVAALAPGHTGGIRPAAKLHGVQWLRPSSKLPSLNDRGYPVAENGSFFGEISAETRRPKTVYVNGYDLNNGTYVRSHFRSLPLSSGNFLRGPPSEFKPFVAGNGSYYGLPNQYGVPKTVHVRGYYRKDGTYVRGHYRSRPRR